MGSKLIYVVDDEKKISDLIASYISKEGYGVKTFSDGESALREFKLQQADMLIIDIMLPGMDGYTLCKELRKISDVPIIMVSAKDDEIDRVLGLELGSDDYIAKPFSPRELVVRVKNIFRRIKDDKDIVVPTISQIDCADLVIYPDERKVSVRGVEIDFTPREYDLLFYLIKNKNRLYKREQLITSIWGYDYIGDTRAIDDLVKKIRKKLKDANCTLEITTVWGYGYKISG